MKIVFGCSIIPSVVIKRRSSQVFPSEFHFSRLSFYILMNTNVNNSDDEKTRLAALKQLKILDTLPDKEFDDINLLASQICETPIAAISLIDKERQWFKSRIGLEVSETHRNCAFCHYTIKEDNLFVVSDACQDARFADNPLVIGEPHIRFYAGAPLITSDGHKIGSLCVIDSKARTLSEAQERSLKALARSVMNLIEARSLQTSRSQNEKVSTIKFSKVKNKIFNTESFFEKYIKSYLIATLVVIGVTLAKFSLGFLFQIESPFLLFVFAILLSAWRGGFGAGIYATLTTTVVINFFFLPPYQDFAVYDPKQYLLFSIFIGQGIFVSALCASRLRNEQLLYQAGTELENRVDKRTDQLAQANSELKQEIQERSLLQEDLRQARDAALETARLKSEFLANMSHEIRTPMNGVIGMTGLILETELNEEQQRFARIIRTSGESLLTIINDILDFSKVEAGKLELEMLDFDLRDTIESLVELFSGKAREKNNELAALIYSDVPLLLRGDAGRIRQILTNLIGNAIKFTNHGDIVTRVKKISENANRVELFFSVTDAGEGISKDVQAKLFQPFTQSDASTTRRHGGTGLGLSISKKLVEIMGGEIGLESEIGKGATFWFKISLEKQSELTSKRLEQSALCPDDKKLNGKRVLIIDDNQVNREILLHQTRSWEMNAFEAQSAKEGFAILDTSAPFDLIILDLQMPEMDGLEAAQHIVAKNKSGRNLPAIIMLSSSGFKLEAQTLNEFNISEFLVKPYRQDDLLNAVCKTFGIKRIAASTETKKITTQMNIHISSSGEEQNPSLLKNKSERILIVEDNYINQIVIQNMLKNFGYNSDVAADGNEALQSLQIIPYDLILMDCQMPEMDGYEATREIRSRPWKAAKTPIIALTAHVTDGEREKCLQAGMDDYLSKPIVKENLSQTINLWLDKSQRKDQEEAAADATETENASVENTDEMFVSPVDFAILDEITDNDIEMRREVVEMYIAQTVTQLSEIENAIKTNDANKLYAVAHKTVGGSLICGMTAIVAPLRKLEQLGREEKTEEALPFYTQAQSAFAAIDKECRKIL